MSAAVSATDLTIRQRKALAKANRRQDARRKALIAAELKRKAEDERQEQIAPSVLRNPIVMADGEVYRHPVLEPAGSGFIRSNPLRHLMARGGDESLITVVHVAAAQRLLATWTHAGETVTSGVSSYGDVRGGDGSATGAMVLRQAACHAEIEAVMVFLGGFWPVVCAVALRGLTPKAYALEIGWDPKALRGYLRGGMDMLVRFYARDDKPGRMRSAEFSSRTH